MNKLENPKNAVIDLGYFNIFVPKQNPVNPYAMVLPVFCKAFLEGWEITINRDGETSRDFTFVENAVLLNELGLFTENKEALNQIYNGACGDQISLNDMVDMLENISGKRVKITHGPERPGDVRHSKANISKSESLLGYKPAVRFEKGLNEVYSWYNVSSKNKA